MINEKFDLLSQFETIGEEFSYEKICELKEEQKVELRKRYDSCLRLRNIGNDPNRPNNWKKKKGDALEELVTYLLKVSGNIFEVKTNLRNSTNEIDQVIEVNPIGKVLIRHGLIDDRLECFLGECKNYDGKVSVTYVGKFCHLILSNSIRIGLLFSYDGVTGQGWSYGAGLIKKFYLHKENLKERYCVLDFNLSDIKSIIDGDNLLHLIDSKIKALRLDTDYQKFLTKHPAE